MWTPIVALLCLLAAANADSPADEGVDPPSVPYHLKSNLDEKPIPLEKMALDAGPKVTYDGAQVLRIPNRFRDELKQFEEDEDFESWGVGSNFSEYYVGKDKILEIKTKLTDKKVPFEIMIDDLQRAIDVENPPLTDEEIDELVGRKGIHAREWISPSVVSYIASEFVENRDEHLADIKGIDFYILPVMNPDGYEYTHQRDRLWRKNRSKSYFCQGTDLNRNWGYKWGGKGSSKQQCKEIYGGSGPFSEPETASVSRFISSIQNTKALWKETEFRLLEQISQLEQQLKGTVELNNNEVYVLRDKVKGTQENVVCLELAVNMHKNTIRELECTNEELTVDVTRLRCEVEEYKKEIQEWCKKERERVSIVESNAILQSKLSQASTESTKKQAEIVRLNGEVGKLRGELERIRLGSVINQPSEALSITLSQLQSALNLERENVKEILKGKESVTKENLDLKRQVKELETIVKRRVKSGNNLPFVSETPMGTHDNKLRESLEHKNKELEQQIVSYQAELSKNQDKIKDMQAKYDHDIICLEQQLKKVQQENSTLKQSLDENIPKSARRLNSASSMSNAASVKEDAHLLATIRGLKLELGTRDKEIMRLNKELEDTKKTNRRLQKEREKALTTNKARGNSNKDFEKPASLPSTSESAKNYNPALFEDGQETLIFLRAENKNLREEIKRLEQDLISLHNKRIQDLSDLQQEHDAEIAQLLRDHALKHSSSTVAHLQGQLYTQQMVISHLKQQVKVLEENAEEIPILKAERDQLESTLMEANKKIARLHDLASPESVQYSGLLEKLEFLERRHEVREQKLQSIVRDLLARQGQDSVCSSTCRDKLMNKNREICYYRAEMDRILDTLAEFKWSK